MSTWQLASAPSSVAVIVRPTSRMKASSGCGVLELVVEYDSLNPRTAPRQALRLAFVRAIDLKVVFALSLAFEAIPERLAVLLVAVTMVFEQAAALLRQRDGVLAGAGHTNGRNQPLFAQVSQVA